MNFIKNIFAFLKSIFTNKMTEKRKVTAQEIFTELVNDFKIKEKVGSVEINLGGITAKYNGRDAIGDLLQEWIGNWFDNQNYYYRTKVNTQEFPDFLLDETDDKGLLEIKTFNANATPAFDIANFNSYCKSLLVKPERLDADYLILSYKMENTELKIDNIWLKKVWEIAGTSGTNPINIQTKYKEPYNLRPINWFTTRKTTNKAFNNRLDFITAISETHKKYPNQTASYNLNWLENVKDKYLQNTGVIL